MIIIRNKNGEDVAHVDDDNKLFLNSGEQIGEVINNKVYSLRNVYLGELRNDMVIALKTLVLQTPSAPRMGIKKSERAPFVKSVKRIIPTGYRSVF
jgi:hypothetical protein